MYTDPFDFLSTRNSLEFDKPITDFKPIQLVQRLPSDYASANLVQGTLSKPEKSMGDLIAERLAKLPDNSPAYKYTTQQEKRYDNPYIQYTPTNLFNTDTEDIYGRKQSFGEQLLNSSIKALATTGSTFVSSFLDTPRQIDAIISGDLSKVDFTEGGAFESVQGWLRGLEDKLPNYYTEKERNRSEWINAFSPTGFANFWGDKFIKNLGFSVGAIGAGLVQEAALSAFTGGLAGVGAWISTANGISKNIGKLYSTVRGLAKSADRIDDIVDIAKNTGNLAKGLEVSKLSRLGTAGRYATTTYLSAQGEAFIEGYNTWLDTKKQLLEDAVNRNTLDAKTLNEIDQRSQEAGKYTTALNLPLLMASNLVQFPNLLMGKSISRTADNFVSIGIKDGLKASSEYTTKKALKEIGLDLIKDSLTEGFEEGAQYHISSTLHDYYANKFNPDLKQGLLNLLAKNVPVTLSDDNFWKEAGLGALTGMVMGSIPHIKTLTNGQDRSEQTAANLNKVYQRFNSALKQYSTNLDLNNPNAKEHITAHDALFASVHDSFKYGSYDNFLDALNDLKSLDIDEFNKAFNHNLNKIERDALVNSLISESNNIKRDIEKVDEFYKKNPYSSDPLTKRIKEALSPRTETELNSYQENLFEDFKEVVARNESLLRRTKGRILQFRDELNSLGIKNESIDYLRTLSKSPKGFGEYLKFKQSQLRDMERQVAYYEELKKASPANQEIHKDLQKSKNILGTVKNYLETIQELHEELKKNPKDKKIQDKILEKFIYEETTEEQRDKYVQDMQEVIKKAQEFQEASQEADSLEEEKSKPEEVADAIITANQISQEDTPSIGKEEVVVNESPTAWLDNHKIGDTIGDYSVLGKDFDNNKLILTKDTHTFTMDKDGTIKSTTPEAEMVKTPLVESPKVTKENTQSSIIQGVEEFTFEEIKSQPDNIYWLDTLHGFKDGSFVYYKTKGKFKKRQLFRDNQGSLYIGEDVFNTQERFIKNHIFVQVYAENEVIITKEKPIDKIDSNLDMFLGKDNLLKQVFRQLIENKTIELNC